LPQLIAEHSAEIKQTGGTVVDFEAFLQKLPAPPVVPPPKFNPGKSLVWFAKQPIDHDQTLLGFRYLCRGGGMFVVAPSGMGKSTLSLQMAILWCCGLVAFGIEPKKALRILIIQAEDDQGDCTEMAAMINHLGLSDREKNLVTENSELIRCNDLVRLSFIEALRDRLSVAKTAGKPFDLVIINPYGVYLGADVKDTAACTQFLNEWLNPLLSEFAIGAILIHHTAKTNFQNTAKYSLWDWAYHGAGAACITNWARAILAIKPENEEMIFRFIAAKRGKRIGNQWENAFERFFSWSPVAGVLCWCEASPEQIAKATASKSKVKFADLDKILECVPVLDPEIRKTIETNVRKKFDLGKHTVTDAINQLLVEGRIFASTIPNPTPGPGRRGFSGLCRTNGNSENGAENLP
jgi:AAA domain-containing protein